MSCCSRNCAQKLVWDTCLIVWGTVPENLVRMFTLCYGEIGFMVTVNTISEFNSTC